MKVFLKSWRDNRRAWIGWAVAVAAVAAMYTSFWPTIGKNADFAKAMDAYPEALKNALHLNDMSKPENYLGSTVFGLLVPMLVAVFAIMAGTKAIATDEESGTLDLVLAHPVSRIKLALQRILAIGSAVALIGTLIWLAVTALRGPVELDGVSAAKIFAICFQLFLFGLLFASITYAVGAWTGRKAVATGAGAAILVLSYLADSFLPQISSLKWTEKFSPFQWYLGNEPLKNGVSLTNAALFAALAVILVALGTWRFGKRDIAV